MTDLASPDIIIRPRVFIPVLTTILGWFVIILTLVLVIQHVIPEYSDLVLTPKTLGIAPFIVLMIALLQFLSIRNTSYYVFPDRIEYRESFLTQAITSVPMHRVTNVSMHNDGIIDRIFKTGKITVLTTGIDSRIDISYVEEPKEIFVKLLEIQSKAIPLGPKGTIELLKE